MTRSKFLMSMTVLIAACGSNAQEPPDVIAQKISEYCKVQICQLENSAIKNAGNNVKRVKTILQIRTQSKTLIFQTKEENIETPISYAYLGFYSEIGYHLVRRVHDFEDFDYLFISNKSAEITVMPNIPHPSPTNKYLVSMLGSEVGGIPNQIVLWEVDGPNLVERFKFLPKMYALFEFDKWVTESVVIFKTTAWSHEGSLHGKNCKTESIQTFPQMLIQKNEQWILESDLKLSMLACRN
jgi:hypothetical protein